MSALTPSGSLREFFQALVARAMQNQRIERSARAELYLANLLSAFSAAEPLTRGAEGRAVHAPLALKYKEAVEASSQEERFAHLRDLGDVALYVSGFFSDYVERRPVDLRYYLSMGEGAYASASGLAQRRAFGEEVAALFQELASKFARFVDVLAEVSEESQPRRNQDVLKLYERWQKTQSAWSARRLRALGVIPGASEPGDTLH
jgi:hypothetical protein